MENNKLPIFTCGNCERVVYLMEAGRGDVLTCCDRKMEEMSEEQKKIYLATKKPFHPSFTAPGSP